MPGFPLTPVELFQYNHVVTTPQSNPLGDLLTLLSIAPPGSGGTISGIDTATNGVTDGDFCYATATANRVAKTDAASIATARCCGVGTATAGTIRDGDAVGAAKFTTAGGAPANGDPVYLALASDDAGTAAGKLTAVPPSASGQVVAEVGICLDNSNYAAFKTCRIAYQVKAPVVLA